MIVRRIGRFFLKGFAWYVEQTAKAFHPSRNIEPPDGEVICPTCLGDGGWVLDWEGGWLDCPACKGRGTVQIP